LNPRFFYAKGPSQSSPLLLIGVAVLLATVIVVLLVAYCLMHVP
jgi:hypothetical protein